MEAENLTKFLETIPKTRTTKAERSPRTNTATAIDPEGPDRFLDLYPALANRWRSHVESKGYVFDPSFVTTHAAWLEIKQYIGPGSNVLELGSGLSTWLIQTQGVASHIALECSPMWFDAVVDSPFKQRADVRLCELRETNDQLDPAFRWEPWEPYSVILIDGPPGEVGRSGILELIDQITLEKHFTIIVDDTHREHERILADEIREAVTTSEVPAMFNKHFHGGKSLAVIQT